MQGCSAFGHQKVSDRGIPDTIAIPGDGAGAVRDSERTLVIRLPAVSPGTLHLADLGFLDLDELAKITRQGGSWISRVPAR